MNRRQYEAMRKQLMDEAQRLLDEGKADEANNKMEEIKKLDQQWDAIAQATANFNALNGIQKFDIPEGMSAQDSLDSNIGQDEGDKVARAWRSEEYRTAWAKTLMGLQLNTDENKAFAIVNEAYTHTTQNTGIVVPETTAKGIWEMAGEYYPYFSDVAKSYVNGLLTMIQEDTSSDAAWYEENIKTEDGKETFKEYKLSGCELSRAITISWKLKEMAIEDFIPFIQRKMAKKLGAAAGYGATHGKGATAESGRPEPMGTVTALLAEEGKPQVVEYAAGSAPTYSDIIRARSKVKSGYAAGLAVYANAVTVWTKLAMVLDANKRPLFVPDVTGKGQFRILGMPVKEDDSMKDGEILLSNANSGYHMNINKMTEDHVKDRKTDYVGYGIMDGNIITSKAHVLLTEASE